MLATEYLYYICPYAYIMSICILCPYAYYVHMHILKENSNNSDHYNAAIYNIH